MPGVKTEQLRARLLRFVDLLAVPRHSGNTPGNTPQRLPARFSPPKGPGDWGLVDWAPPFSWPVKNYKPSCVLWTKLPQLLSPSNFLPPSLPAEQSPVHPSNCKHLDSGLQLLQLLQTCRNQTLPTAMAPPSTLSSLRRPRPVLSPLRSRRTVVSAPPR